MNDIVLLDQPRPMWWLEPATETERSHEELGDILRLGGHSIPLDEIMSYRLEEVVDRDVEGRLLIGAFTLIGALVFLIGILGLGWLECLLAAFVVACGTVIAGLAEICGVTSRRSFRISVFSQNARPATYTSADNRDIARLIDFLDKAIGR